MGKPSAFELTQVEMEVNAVWYYNLVTDGKGHNLKDAVFGAVAFHNIMIAFQTYTFR